MRRSNMQKMHNTLPPVKESEFQANVRDLALRLHWLCYHTHDSRRSDPGFPDDVFVRAPRVVFMELKSEGGQLTPEQVAWKVTLQACPGVEYYGPLKPDDWERIVKVLQEG